jgi:hypothetical protein
MSRIIIILLLSSFLFLANAQDEKCKTCNINQPSTSSDRLGDVYKNLNSSRLNDARVTILPVDLIILADNVEITIPMFNDEVKKKVNISISKFTILENLTISMLILDKAKEWAEKNKLKVNENELIFKYKKSLTDKLTSNDTEGKSYYNGHKVEYNGKKYEHVAKEIKKKLLIEKKAIFIKKYIAELIKSYYIEINQDWLEKTIGLPGNKY